MANTISVDAKILHQILTRLDTLTKDMQAIKEKVLSQEPSYGSNEWWEKEIKEADKEFKKGKGIVINNKKELDEFFRNL